MPSNRTTAAIAMLLILSFAISLVAIPAANAHTPPLNIQLFAYCNVAPNPVGVGQWVNVGFWLNQPPPDARGPYGDRWTGMTVKVTKPNGDTETLGPFTSDDTGGTHYEYAPAMVGTYTFQMSFPGQTLAGDNLQPGTSSAILAYVGDYYLPATSNIATLTVQNEPVGGVSVAPLPTSYWQTPINAMNVNNWYAVGGASLGFGGRGGYNASSNYNPYTTAPTTAHILWTKPEAFGGVLGGQYGGTTTYGNYYSTAQYERKYNPVIMNGYLYYNVIPGSSTTPAGLVCVDLYTGKTVWTDDAHNLGGGSSAQSALTANGLCTTILCGQILDFVSPNQYGGLAYIWTTGTPAGITSTGTTYNMFDAETGTYILSIVNGTGMTLTEDQGGNLIGYYLNQTAGTQTIDGPINPNTGPARIANTINGPSLNEWNSTQCIQAGAWSAQAAGWYWRPPQNGIIDFSLGIMWRTPVATNISGVPIPSYSTAPGGIRGINSGVILLAAFASAGGSYFQAGYGVYSGYSADTGQQLWVENVTMVPFTENGNTGASSIGDGVWTIPSHQDGVIRGFSLNTGQLLWTTSLLPQDAYNSLGGYMTTLANGTLYLAGFGGDIWSINMLTGKINWYTNTTILQGSSGTNTPYGVWPIWGFSNGGVAGGILFLEEGHEYSPPLFLGAQQLAINCTTGELAWSIHAFDVNGVPATAYGVMTVINAYDNQIYAYAMGPSKTTVTAPSIGVTTATPITITGSVMDISAGSQQEAVAANFPNGLPCVSDASMSQFMETVYMQQPMPTNVTGVPVTLSVIDSNGNYRQIGTTTTNAMGTYGFTWTPDIPGNYAVIATFAGSGSYYGSSAQTYFYATEAPTATPASTPTPASMAEQYFMPMSIGLIITMVVVIALLALLLLRKRP